MEVKKTLGMVVIFGLCTFFLGYFIDNSFLSGSIITGNFFLNNTVDILDPTLVLHLDFNNESDPWRDSSIYEHSFVKNGQVTWFNGSECKWYGCANFSITDGTDFLESTSNFSIEDGIAVSFWVYYTTSPWVTSSAELGMGHYSDGNRLYTENTGIGRIFSANANYGDVSVSTSSSNRDDSGQWYNYFIQYNKSGVEIYRNGELIKISSQEYGSINYSVGELIYIGKIAPYGGTDLEGYLDELTIWNRSNFTSIDVNSLFDLVKLGTPPEIDVFVKEIKYDLPYDFSAENNTLDMSGSLEINVTFENGGINAANNFDYLVNVNSIDICSGQLTLSGGENATINCYFSKTYGFHTGFVNISTSDDNLENNFQRIYLPLLNRPFFHFNLSEFYSKIYPFFTNMSNAVAYNSYNYYSNFDSSDFNENWDGNDVDPYGKNVREDTMSCLLNMYNTPSKGQCDEAVESLYGWANRTVNSYSNPQSTHYLSHVGIAFDIMFPYLTENQYDYLVPKFYNICQQISDLAELDSDDSNEIQGGNGKGFGSGNAAFCYSIIGTYSQNPTLIDERNQYGWGKNIPEMWMNREINFLRSRKNDSWTKYQEGWSYKLYAENHIVENLLFRVKYQLGDILQYQQELNSMAAEMISSILDFNYNGNILRNDNDYFLRAISNGDSQSYVDISSGSFLGGGMMTYYGTLTNESNIKQAILWLRDKMAILGDYPRSYVDLYLYQQVFEGISEKTQNISSVFNHKIIFDNANDIFMIRTNYTYTNDNVIQVDGGEERGGGHSQAQGYFLYALGEPFLDYEQVPYLDDTRIDEWKNGISLKSLNQSIEGVSGIWNQFLGEYGNNQYYGSKDNSFFYDTDYPNYRRFPLEYGGDLEDYIGTEDANFAGVFVWRPYYNADNVNEYFVKYGDMLVKRTTVSNNNEGEIFHNFININDEFSETRFGNNLTFTRSNKNLDINVVHSSQAAVLGGGETNVTYCFSKTSCSGSARGLGHYRRTYLYTPSSDWDFILAHHWYYDGDRLPTEKISGVDNGVKQSNNYVIYDTNNDGITQYQTKSTDGWALAFNDAKGEVASFNATTINIGYEIFKSDIPISVHIDRNLDNLIITANTMTRDPYIDVSKTARVTIDAREIGTNLQIRKNNDTLVIPVVATANTMTFDLSTEQNSDYYVVTAMTGDSTSPQILDISLTGVSNTLSFVVQTDELANLSVDWGYVSPTNKATNSTYQATSVVNIPNATTDITIYYYVTSCDANANCVTNGTYTFMTTITTTSTIASVTTTTLEYSTSTGGGGGGGGGGYIPPATDPIVEENGTTYVVFVDLINQTTILDPNVDPLDGSVYQYFVGDEENVAIDGEWLDDNNVDPEDVTVYQYDAEWLEVPSEFVQEENGLAYYKLSGMTLGKYALGADLDIENPMQLFVRTYKNNFLFLTLLLVGISPIMVVRFIKNKPHRIQKIITKLRRLGHTEHQIIQHLSLKKLPKHEIHKHLKTNHHLHNYIGEQLKKGFSSKQIKEALKKQGWKKIRFHMK